MARADESGNDEQGFAEMLFELGAEPNHEGGAEEATDDIRDATIRALTADLQGLRELGDELARVEQERLALAARVEVLEAEAADDCSESAAVARLERKLGEREGVLDRTRERLAQQRAKTEEWKSKAAERWHQIGSMRKRAKELERELEAARDAAQPGPLPRSSGSGSRAESDTRRSSHRAS